MVFAAGGVVMAAAVAIALVRRRLVVITVQGISMLPTYRPGERVLVRRAGLDRVRRGDVVVVREPEDDRPAGTGWMIKRLAAVPGDPHPAGDLPAGATEQDVPAGLFAVRGDNTGASYDSRYFGFLPASDLLGVVTRRFGSANVSTLNDQRTSSS